VVVDNGSVDATARVAGEFAQIHPWIRLIDARPITTTPDIGAHPRGAPIVAAFHAGLTALGETKPELVAKVDADISMDGNHFERLIQAFDEDPALGIASGTCLEMADGEWRQRYVTGASVWGAARMYRRTCLEHVLPLEERMGWDGIDIVKANVRGWKTVTLLDLPFRHHRPEAVREVSQWHAWAVQGDASHYMGYRPSYVVARTVHHIRRDPAALAMLWSFIVSTVKGGPTCPDPSVRDYVRRMQRFRHIPARRREAVGRQAQPDRADARE
jgi:glycosyltransferase involved in cell wall biosynthesis